MAAATAASRIVRASQISSGKHVVGEQHGGTEPSARNRRDKANIEGATSQWLGDRSVSD